VADIKPFNGYRYSLKNPADLSLFIAPPYDMIDGSKIDSLYKQDKHNVVRIIQNKKEKTDKENKDRHVRASGFIEDWIKKGVFAQDNKPSLYGYTQDFTVGDISYRRTAVIALVKLVDYDEGIVQPHEYTLTGPKADRYELLQATNTQSELIFGIVPDNGNLYKTILSCVYGSAAGTFESEGGVRHSVYRTDDTELINALTLAMKDKTILIADGHHRYETCLKYFRDSNNPAAGYAVMALVSMADPGLVIRPFHRLIRSSPGKLDIPMIKALAAFFDVNDCGASEYSKINDFLDNKIPGEMLFCDHLSNKLYSLTLNKAGEKYLTENPHGMSLLWNRLNVSEINSIVVNKILSLPLDGTVLHDLIDYVNDPAAAYNKIVDKNSTDNYRGCFFIKALDISTVNAIVSGGERMPQKSTNFFPKCFSGLVFYKMEKTS
jgi:uncharacterized protein (DUF1015 family)